MKEQCRQNVKIIYFYGGSGRFLGVSVSSGGFRGGGGSGGFQRLSGGGSGGFRGGGWGVLGGFRVLQTPTKKLLNHTDEVPYPPFNDKLKFTNEMGSYFIGKIVNIQVKLDKIVFWIVCSSFIQ